MASWYTSQIRAAVSDCDPRHVEAYMRLEFSTLDGLSSRFAKEARAAAACVREDVDAAERLAKSYGL